MKKRLVWVRDHHFKLTNPFSYVCFLDEKLFYTTTRRNKIKKLPRGPYEKEGADVVIQPKVISRRFPVKSMFLGVVSRPIPHRNFDGRIHLERISTQETVKKLTATQNFSDDVIVNQAIKNGEWRQLFDTDSPLSLSALEVKRIVADHFALDAAVVDRLELSYITFIGENEIPKTV